eukprot:8003372-Lingulodinium_polyedra.AAC.1
MRRGCVEDASSKPFLRFRRFNLLFILIDFRLTGPGAALSTTQHGSRTHATRGPASNMLLAGGRMEG